MVIFVSHVNSSVPTRRCVPIFMFVSFTCQLAFLNEMFLFTCHWAHLDINIDIGGVWLEVHLFYFFKGCDYIFHIDCKDADETDLFSHRRVRGKKSELQRANPLSLAVCVTSVYPVVFGSTNDLSPSLPKVFFVNDQWVSMSWVVRFFARFHMFIPEVVFTVVMFSFF